MTLASRAPHSLASLVLLLLASAAPSVHAQSVPPADAAPPATSPPPPEPMTDRFEALDRDGDALISREEAARDPALVVAFADLDDSRDGALDLAEFAPYVGSMRSL